MQSVSPNSNPVNYQTNFEQIMSEIVTLKNNFKDHEEKMVNLKEDYEGKIATLKQETKEQKEQIKDLQIKDKNKDIKIVNLQKSNKDQKKKIDLLSKNIFKIKGATEVLGRKKIKPKKEVVSLENGAQVLKILVKAGTKKIMTHKLGRELLLGGAGKFLMNTKIVTKIAGEAGADMIGKKIPILSLVSGVGFGIKRFRDGETLQGLAEITSGMAGCFPGLGTATGTVIDACILASDVYLSQKEKNEIDEQTTICCYHYLGFKDIDPNHLPTRAEVDKNFQQLIEEAHPDPEKSLENTIPEEFCEDIIEATNVAKNWIYKQSGWKATQI